MRSKNVSYSCLPKMVALSPSNLNLVKIFILALSLISFSFILGSIQSFNKANAVDSLGQTIQQFNNNLRSGIDKHIQSNLNQATEPLTNNNTNNCSGNDNFVTQSHADINGQTTTSINNPSCDGSTPAISPFD